MRESSELKELNSRLLEIINECKSEEGTKRLQAIYDTLNGNNALQVVGLAEKVENFLHNLFSKHKKEILQNKLDTARKDTLNTIRKYIFTENIITESISEYVPSNMELVINRLLDVSLGIEFNEKTVKRYPINLTNNIKSQAYSKVLLEMSREYLNNHISVNQVVERSKKLYRRREKEIEDKSRHFEIEPYYGTKEFMQARIEYIRSCMEKMLNNERFKDRKDIEEHIDRISEILSKFEDTVLDFDSKNYKEEYKHMEELYKDVLKREKTLSPEVASVWNDTLTSVESYTKDSNFAFIVQEASEQEFETKDINNVSMKYITQNTLALDGDYGLIYLPDAENIYAISSEDTGSCVITKEDFINSRI